MKRAERLDLDVVAAIVADVDEPMTDSALARVVMAATGVDFDEAKRVVYSITGRCAECTRPWDRSAGRVTCDRCMAKRGAKSAERYHSRREAGLCVRCGVAATGHLCDLHLRDARACHRESFKRKQAAGQCRWCDKDAVPGRTLCADHAARVLATQDKTARAAAEPGPDTVARVIYRLLTMEPQSLAEIVRKTGSPHGTVKVTLSVMKRVGLVDNPSPGVWQLTKKP